MRHLRLLQYYYLQEAYWDFNFGIDIHQLILYKYSKNEVYSIIQL